MKIFAAVLMSLLFVLTVPAHCEPLPGQEIITANEVLRGSFSEMQRSKGIDQPTPVTGHVVVAPATGLIWVMEKPFPTASVVTPQAMVQLLGNLPIAQMRSSQAPYIFALYSDLCAALGGDWHALERDFTVTHTQTTDGHWQLDLTPLPADAKAVPFHSIVLTGHRFLETAQLSKMNGDFQRFTFADMAVSPAPVSPAEAASFNLATR